MQRSLFLLMVACFALASCKDVNLGADGVDAGGGKGGGGGSTGGTTGAGGAGGSAGTPGTGGSTQTGGTTSATGGTTSSPPNCAMVGCSPPPLCSEGCTATCGCCPCATGTRSGDLICTKSGCYDWAAAPDAGILVACSGQGDPLCGQGSSCIVGCPSKGAGGLCSVAGREACGCGSIDQPCTTPGLECLYPSCCDYQGLCLTPPERQAVCAGPLAAKFNCTPAVGNPDAGTDAGLDQAADVPQADAPRGGAGGSGGTIGTGGTTASPAVDAGASSCNSPLPLQCGDRLNHSTLIQGRASVWSGYNCSQRAESGREAIYAFQTTAACQVAVQLKNLTLDLDLFVLTGCAPGPYDKCSSTPLDLQTIETVDFTSQAGQPYFVVVDGYNGAAGTYTLQVDCTCNQDAGTIDAPRIDASGDSAVAPGCDLDVAAKAIAASGVTVVGSPQTLNVTLPTTMATDENWGLKERICQQGGYDIAPLGGKTVCLVEQGSTQLCQGAPSNVWVVMNDGAVACIYKALRPGAAVAPGLYSVTDPNCS